MTESYFSTAGELFDLYLRGMSDFQRDIILTVALSREGIASYAGLDPSEEEDLRILARKGHIAIGVAEEEGVPTRIEVRLLSQLFSWSMMRLFDSFVYERRKGGGSPSCSFVRISLSLL